MRYELLISWRSTYLRLAAVTQAGRGAEETHPGVQTAAASS
jgi:hypothetical protein